MELGILICIFYEGQLCLGFKVEKVIARVA